MAGLNDLSSAIPPGTETPTLGDDRIRLVTAKLIEFAAVAHTLAGKHKIAKGPISSRPAYGNAGDFYILEVAGLLAELQYDTGSAWVTLTSRNDIADFLASLATHQAATPIDHPASSVTSAKIAAAAILKKHLEGGSDVSPISALVDGSSADSLHDHAKFVEITDLSEVSKMYLGVGPWRWAGSVSGYRSLYQNWFETSPASDPPLSPTFVDFAARRTGALWECGNPIGFEVFEVLEAPVNLRIKLYSLFAINQVTWTVKAGIGTSPTLTSFTSTVNFATATTVASQDMGVIYIASPGTYYFGIQATSTGAGGSGEVFVNRALLTLEEI